MDASYCEMEVPKGQADVLRAQTDASNVSDRAKMDVIGHGENASTYLIAGDARCGGDVTDGIGSHTDVPSRHSDMSSIETDANRSANMTENISIPRKRVKLPDPPISAVKQLPDQPNGLSDQTDTSSMQTDMHSTENETETVRKRQTEAQAQYSPVLPRIDMANPTYRWKRVSIGNGYRYVPWNAPVEMPGRTFAFGQLERAGEVIAPSIEGETDGNGDGD